MDPLSTGTGIIAILQLSTEVVKYIIGVAGSTKDRRRLRSEIIACEAILMRLQDLSDDAREESKSWENMKAIEGKDSPLYRLGLILDATKTKLEPKQGLSKALAPLKWPFEEKEVEKLIAAVQREKALLQLAITNECR